MSDFEEARKAMIAKRFAGMFGEILVSFVAMKSSFSFPLFSLILGNSKGASTGTTGSARRKKVGQHKTGGGEDKPSNYNLFPRFKMQYHPHY